MRTIPVLSVVLILIGAAVLGFDHYNYTTTESFLHIGSLNATTEVSHTIQLPPMIGWLLIACGACVLAFAALSRDD
jgi:hypothetical protein